MAKSFDFYFDFTSPYGYIASTVVDGLAARHGFAARWRIVLVTAAYKQFEASNPLTHKAKAAYFRLDIPRTAAHFDAPFVFPKTWPENLIAPARAFSWLEDRDPERARRFAKAALAAYWAEGRALASVEVTADVAAACGEDRAAVAAALNDAAVKQGLVAKVDAALAAGIFGSPQIVLNGEIFWGTDRFDQLEAALDRAQR
jgi:2-hydroxychromene-2-carboxylate isomerase